ncbi:MAG: FAD:protein FMN transferase [Gammaproteobacteria bacterium]|nr:FAD:protein FMN transferase [Gammaproteobacteria bacterium]
MGSPCEIQLFAPDESVARAGAEHAIADIARLEARYSRYREDSLLSQINRIAAQGGSIEVDDETASLLNYAATCHAESNGLFDITSGILRRAWRFNQERLPTPAEIAALKAHIGWHRLRWQAPRLSFPEAGLELDFGGVVKEYAVDRAAALCQERGFRHGVVNLGGDIKIVGPRADGQPWRIGIKHPRSAAHLLDTIELERGALASSGDYERCIVVDGVRYGHILNPHSGWPVRHLAAVSVVADFCVIAGSASTIAMLKEEDGPAWLAALGLRHLWVDVNGNSGGDLTP